MKYSSQKIEQFERENLFLFYTSRDGKLKMEVYWSDENVWLTQKKMAELYGVDRTVITKHLKNIFESDELEQDQVCALFAHTAEDSKVYETRYYNLDAILSIQANPRFYLHY